MAFGAAMLQKKFTAQMEAEGGFRRVGGTGQGIGWQGLKKLSLGSREVG